MYESTGLKEFPEGRKTRLCGIVAGYAVCAVPGGKVGEINLETTAVNGFDNVRDALIREKFEGFRVVTAVIRTQYVEVSVRFSSAPQLSDWEKAAGSIAGMLRRVWYLPKETCLYCNKDGCDCAGYARDSYRAAHRECYQEAIEKAVKRIRGRKGAAPVLGAAAGALLVLLMNLAVLLVARTSYPFTYVFGCFLAWSGYIYMRGPSGKGSAICAGGLSLLFTLLSELLTAVLTTGGISGYLAEPQRLLLALGFWAAGTAVMAPKMLKSAARLEQQRRDTMDTVIPLNYVEEAGNAQGGSGAQ